MKKIKPEFNAASGYSSVKTAIMSWRHNYTRDYTGVITWRNWSHSADERLDNPPPQGNQEPSVVRLGWKTPDELGVSKSMECDFSPLLLTLLVEGQERYPACKS